MIILIGYHEYTHCLVYGVQASAQRWLNAWMLRRRTKPFTDCDRQFKHLNGKCSMEMTIKKQAQWPEICGVQAPNMKR